MIPSGRVCQIKHNPPESHGDCVRACIASLIDRDDVPHVFDDRDPLESWRLMREYLALHKKTIAVFPLEEHAEFMTVNNSGVPYLLFHQTEYGPHVVICRDGKKVHDPSWGPVPIGGPISSIGVYIVGIFGDLI